MPYSLKKVVLLYYFVLYVKMVAPMGASMLISHDPLSSHAIELLLLLKIFTLFYTFLFLQCVDIKEKN